MKALAGCSYETIRLRARALGLPARPTGRSKLCGPLFEALWRAGVACHEIAKLFDSVEASIGVAAAGLALPPRARGGWRPLMTLAEFQERTLAAAMQARSAKDARAVLAAMKQAESQAADRQAA
ncbi:MAG: hypothetical protein Q7V20_23080 [Aquabacterium sp.]|uniref:hypothetical protein n=1 Tax=Aquabacterium sp. TaxID=1872578 RepID=UPI00271B3BA6|nr:hypothetical protein [Aquabacterium sp.]MDO9006338.1 hypothetical protein [Aquabacterium sp.]